MAVARLGPIFADVSGTIGGLTVRRVGSRYIIASHQCRGPSPSSYTGEGMRVMLNDRALWLGLSDAQRQDWRRYALQHLQPDGLGNKLIMPAFRWFQRWRPYATLVVAGQPDPHYEPPYEDRVSFAAGSLTLAFSAGGVYEITAGAGLMPFGFSKLEIWASRMVHPGRTTSKFWRKLGFKTYVTYTEDVVSLFAAAGMLLVEGETVAIRARWAIYKHWPGPWSYGSTVVTA